MKKKVGFIKCNARQIFEVIGLAGAIAIPWILDLQSLFTEYLSGITVSPDNVLWYITLTFGRPVASIVLLVIAVCAIRKINDEFMMNRKYAYHDYYYAWYWFCAKILGIKKCNLVLVPIHMQFKLVIRGTFCEYPLSDEDYPAVENEPDCKVMITHEDKDMRTVNLVLEDTYAIKDKQLPKTTRGLFTIKVSRFDGSNSRHYSSKFIDTIALAIKKYKRIQNLNIYATTNPKNTLNITRRVFGSVERGNIVHLYVFQQENDGERMFENTGHKVF